MTQRVGFTDVTIAFSSNCYGGEAILKGTVIGNQLTGQLSVPQHVCNEEGGFIPATGFSHGTAEASQIQFETDSAGTADCPNLGPSSTVVLSR